MSSELTSNCPRCGAQNMTFDLTQIHCFRRENRYRGSSIYWHEGFCICRGCKKSTVFLLVQTKGDNPLELEVLLRSQYSINHYVTIERYVSLTDTIQHHPPEHLPENIESAFNEGVSCCAIGCFNAAGGNVSALS